MMRDKREVETEAKFLVVLDTTSDNSGLTELTWFGHRYLLESEKRSLDVITELQELPEWQSQVERQNWVYPQLKSDLRASMVILNPETSATNVMR